MKGIRCLCTAWLVLSLSSGGMAQITEQPEWQFAPSLLFVDYFHGARIEGQQGLPGYNFSGEGLTVQFRSFHRGLDPLSFTMSAGVIWFTNSGGGVRPVPILPMGTTNGIGYIMRNEDLTDFPLALGVDAVFPKTENHDIMVFGGISFVTNFIDGDIDPGQQIKVGYKIGGGLTVKMFEFSVHYYSFSDMQNIGTSIGLRLNSFGAH